ncbi:MAG: oligosaccharide flippase family protein [Gemmatimonadota bacterium]|nr:oligosaccharide flippase family protein [Gemmatimonadota bacterium]
MWTLILGVAVVPIYLRILGVEGYGLVGVFSALQTVISLFDFGLGTTLNRQLARSSGVTTEELDVRNLTRTLEVAYWTVVFLLVALCAATAPWIARHWIHAVGLPPSRVESAVMLMGLAAAFQLPFALYGGGLLGLQQHVMFNALVVGVVTVRSAGALLVLRLVSNTVEAFFAWQACVSLGQSLLAAILLWRKLAGPRYNPRFDSRLLSKVWRFAFGVGAIAALGVLQSQIDKILVSRLLPLAELGYYALAGVFASGVYMLALPLFTTYFPRFAELAKKPDSGELRFVYHQACQFVSSIVLPTAAVAALFSREVMVLWTGDMVIATRVSGVASLLIVGSAMVALGGAPGALQLAYGWTGLGLRLTAISIVLDIPILYFAINHYGVVGAAAAWVGLYASQMAVFVCLMHRRLLTGEGRRWLVVDVALPAISSVLLATLGRLLMPSVLQGAALALYLAFVSVVTLFLTVTLMPLPRRALTQVLTSRSLRALRRG